MTDALLELESFSVGFGERTVLADLTLALPRRGLTLLLGPGGAGKSTLLRTLAGLNDAHPALSISGSARFAGAPLQIPREPTPLGVRHGIGMVVQHARFFLDTVRENLVSALPRRSELDPAAQTRWACGLLESHGLCGLVSYLDEDVASLPSPMQRQLAVVRALAPDPQLLFADEPTAGLDERDALGIVELLRAQAEVRSILLVTHHQRLARAAGGTVLLLAGGRLRERAPTSRFFAAPSTPSGETFVRTGNCADPSPEVRPAHRASPRGFFWLWPGRLGGLPRPGIIASLEEDLDGLQRLGVTTLVTLEETETLEPALLAARGLAAIHFPVADMGAPALSAQAALCRRIGRLTAEGAVVALHCRAGLGRTGTALAAQLVYDGRSASAAIDQVRQLNPLCIQSPAQVQFLAAFEAFLAVNLPSRTT